MLWNPANISKLWDSSGQDYPTCNSEPKTLVGFQLTATAKKCFVSTADNNHYNSPFFYHKRPVEEHMLEKQHLVEEKALELDEDCKNLKFSESIQLTV